MEATKFSKKSLICTISIGVAAGIGATLAVVKNSPHEASSEFEYTGVPVFDAWLSLVDEKGLKAYAKQYEAIKDERGSPRFTELQIRRFYQLNLTLDEVLHFHDTEKPNALFIYPSFDPNYAFYNSNAQNLFTTIKRNYDVHVRVSTVEQEAYAAIDEVPHIELLVLSGHGNKASLRLGERNLTEQKYANYRDEEFMIDIYDMELLRYLGKLSPNAIVFLNSCSTAAGGKDADNLANFVGFAANRRKVIASNEDFKSEQMRFVSTDPLELRINVAGKDTTYSNK